ncbi:hypothetical protein C7U60_15265 [Mesorhizobium plurifarium]|nr:hypothetical protein C7U60_15265 [Mesorhizobium plurifarium]
MVLVVGPSGAGKETLLNLAKEKLAGDERFRFVQRIITRPAGGGENSGFATAEIFQRLVTEGLLSLHWQAHGLSYGLPIIVDEWLAKGDVVVANGSRTVLADFQAENHQCPGITRQRRSRSSSPPKKDSYVSIHDV